MSQSHGAALRYSQYAASATGACPQQPVAQQSPSGAAGKQSGQTTTSASGSVAVVTRQQQQQQQQQQQHQHQHQQVPSLPFMRPPLLVTSSGATMLPAGANGGSGGRLPKYPGSLSGSDTDVSTSTENLSREERYVLSHARVEPQGEENLQGSVTPVNEMQGRFIGDKFSSNTSTDSTRYVTAIGGMYANIGPGPGTGNDGSSNRSSMVGGGGGGSNRNSLKEPNSNRSSMDVSQSSYNTLIIHDDVYGGGINNNREYAGSPPPYMTKKERPRSYGEAQVAMQEISEIPEEYLNQSHVLKHLAKEVKLPASSTRGGATRSESLARDSTGSQTAAAEGGGGAGRHWSGRQQSTTSSTASTANAADSGGIGESGEHQQQQKKAIDKRKAGSCEPTGGTAAAAAGGNGKLKSKSQPDLTRLYDIDPEELEALVKENQLLKQQLNNCYLKVAKSQKLEQEIANIYRVHEELVQSCDRRERLERAARTRLQQDCRRLQELNRAFRDQVEVYQSQLHASSDHQLGRTQQDVLISQLVNQNKSLVDANRRQCIELQAQNATLEEQRIHINVLDTALKRLEEECRQKQVYVERCAQLQHALQSLQNASERREQAERKLRIDYDNDLPNRSGSSTNSETDNLKWQLREKDAQIIRLEAECTKLEQRNLEESNVRNVAKMAMERNSQETERILAEAKQEKIRYLDEAHAANRKVTELQTRLKLVENRLAEKDAMIRAYHGQKIYGGSTNSYGSYNLSTDSFALNPLGAYNSQTSYVDVSSNSFDVVGGNAGAGSLLDPSVVGPYVGASSVATSYASTYGQTNPSFAQSSLNLPGHGAGTGSVMGGAAGSVSVVGNGVTGCYSSPGSSTTSNYSSTNFGSGTPGSSSEHTIYDSKNYELRSIDDQLKQLDEQLLNKRGLCCFPSLTTKKPIQSLLAADEVSVLSANNSEAFLQNLAHIDRRSEQQQQREDRESGAGSQKATEDMVLLEKQGRCSQKLRGGSSGSSTGTATLGNLAHVSQAVGQNMTDISNIGSSGLSGVGPVGSGGNKMLSSIAKQGSGVASLLGASHRGSSLPPSALPRPPRSLKPPRKIEYGRLSDGGGGDGGALGGGMMGKKTRAVTPPSPVSSDSPKDTYGGRIKRPGAVGGVRDFSPAKGGYVEMKDTLQLTGCGGGSLKHKSYGSMNAVAPGGGPVGGHQGGTKFGFVKTSSGSAGSGSSGGSGSTVCGDYAKVDYPSTKNYQRLEETPTTPTMPTTGTVVVSDHGSQSSSQSRKSSADSGTLKRTLLPNVRKPSPGIQQQQQTIPKGGSRDSLNSASSGSNHSNSTGPAGMAGLSRSSPLRSTPTAGYHHSLHTLQRTPPRFIHHQQSTSTESTKSNYAMPGSQQPQQQQPLHHGFFSKFASQSVSPARTITQPKSSSSLPSSSVLQAAVSSSATSAIGQSSTASLPPKPAGLDKQFGPAAQSGTPSAVTTGYNNPQRPRGTSLARVGNKYRIQF
ncbi:uncharacterized protein LOC128268994 [Anopheles cruzii]|uniref:uncharacterized protein LOC128268994 n=1 Tax=Anopheles cruzii TaxID=68878 RepID=UPI0022EC2C04|nr:uncharacterized protein LOC128268994 [Anopheles cruzii]